MPAGVSMGEYIKFFTAAMLSMLAGAQLVHMYYKPLQDLDTYIEREKANAKKAANIVSKAGLENKTDNS